MFLVPATGAVGAAGGSCSRGARAGAGGAAADFLQGGGAAQLGAAGGARRAVPPSAWRRRLARRAASTLVGPVRLGRIWPRTGPGGSRTAASGKGTATSGATKFAISTSRTTPAISGRRTLVGRPGPSPVPSPGQTWGSVGSWCGYSGEPTSYSYGENVYYADDQVYYGDQPVATTEEYAEQAEAIATTAPSAAPEQGDWLPLGVFAITQDGQASGAEPSLYMQLAISKQGVISGTLKNTLTGKVQTLEGMADKKSQRVAWVVAGQERPIMETGLSNLTQDTAPALIHFADGQTQQWLMVRIPEPKQ